MKKTPAEDALEPLVISYKTARRLLDIGPTKLHDLLNQGKLTKTQIGSRPAIVYSSLKELVRDGIAVRPRGRSASFEKIAAQ